MNKKIICGTFCSFLLMQSVEPMELSSAFISEEKSRKNIVFFEEMLKKFEKNIIVPEKMWSSMINPDFDFYIKVKKYRSSTEYKTTVNAIELIDHLTYRTSENNYFNKSKKIIKESSLHRLVISIKDNEHLLYEIRWDHDMILFLYETIQKQLINSASKKNNIQIDEIETTFKNKELIYSLLKKYLDTHCDKKIYSFKEALRLIVRLNIEEARYNFMAKYIFLNKFKKANSWYIPSLILSYIEKTEVPF